MALKERNSHEEHKKFVRRRELCASKHSFASVGVNTAITFGMLSWNPANLRSGPLFIHLSDVDDGEITRQVVSGTSIKHDSRESSAHFQVQFLRSKKIPLLPFKGGYSCSYEPHRLAYELRKRCILLTGLRTLNGRSFWTVSRPTDFGSGLGVSPKNATHHRSFV